ncbi:hypothetical protein ACWGLE_25050 [Streptomyces sp. NPDC055897]
MAPDEALAQVSGLPERFATLLQGRQGDEQHPELSWNAAAYVSHVADNLRNWAERLAGARLAGACHVADYDQDLLAQARCYNDASLAGALWSLESATGNWMASVSAALVDDVTLEHAERGLQRAEDVARNNAHDAAHHAWDIERILTYTDQPRPS